MFAITRRKTKTVTVGNVKIGSDHPISIQTMTNTKTTDVKATIAQINKCVYAGAEIVRVSVPDAESTHAFKEITQHSPVPIIADVHFHYKRGIEAAQNGAACLRINPGNVGTKERALEIVKAAKDYNCSIRIGVNAGSLEENLLQKYGEPCPEAMVESGANAIKMLEDVDFYNFKISVKASNVLMMVKSYEMLAKTCDYPLHLGVTEAGPFNTGIVKSSMGLGSLLIQGIGDTIRVSLSTPPEEEATVGWNVLKGLGLRTRGVDIVSCPSCARQQFDVIKIVSEIERETAHFIKPLKISILGCVVNGLGEARESDIGVTGAGSGQHLIYVHGEPKYKSTSENLKEKILQTIAEIQN